MIKSLTGSMRFDIDNEPAAQRTYPYVTLFMISFVTLFVEIALTPIRNN